ncbi:GNAT family N-acetyltransferase [uncultured Nocardioides sp.]|uniref:GNAT family N-acetyltransferase n=1 Tax=uncultured Nocardioides sp. TaxID=198441 RepID=UPI00262E2348|nr:GNAT family N-acetyltransferase [uncultured Nocardioides sp.]
MARWSFTRDPVAFLDAAGGVLSADPLVATVVATVAERYAARAADPAWTPPDELRWFATAFDASGAAVGAAMRTHPSPPHPPFVLPCPEEAAVALARTLHDRGEEVGGVNGAAPAVSVVAEELARLGGARVVEDMATRIFEVTDVAPMASPPGHLRRARPDDVAVCSDWFDRFDAEADAQAGREPGPAGRVDSRRVPERVAAGTLWVWEVDSEPVHASVLEPPAYGMSRVALVYTPPEHRGHGYAARAVAELAAARLGEGSRVCLFADRDNPVSTGVYERIGFRAAVDTADLLLVQD